MRFQVNLSQRRSHDEKAYAQEALALPLGNTATYIQKAVVPKGTRLQKSHALPVKQWNRTRGGAEQFELTDQIPDKNFGDGVILH
tara:strand:+ start:959 stop:1213 length:255 start_codon:yes stop_codon:yes gene_type:complete